MTNPLIRLRSLISLAAITFLSGGLSSCSFSEEDMRRRSQANIAWAKKMGQKRAAEYHAKQNRRRSTSSSSSYTNRYDEARERNRRQNNEIARRGNNPYFRYQP